MKDEEAEKMKSLGHTMAICDKHTLVYTKTYPWDECPACKSDKLLIREVEIAMTLRSQLERLGETPEA